MTLNRPFAERNAFRAKHAKGVDAVDGWGIGGPSRAYVVQGESLKPGSLEDRNVVASITTQAKAPSPATTTRATSAAAC